MITYDPFERLAVMEPPFRTEGAPPAPDRYVERLQENIAVGNRGGAAGLFMVEAVGQPQEAVDSFKGTPMWAELEAMAPTLVYDALQMGDSKVPVDLLGRIEVETLALHSAGSPDWLKEAVRQTADALPAGRAQELPGEFHQIPPNILVPALTSYLLG